MDKAVPKKPGVAIDGFLRRLRRYGPVARGTLRVLFRSAVLLVLCFGLLEVLTPSLDFTKGPGAFSFDSVAGGTSRTDALGNPLPEPVARRLVARTSDSRTLTADVLALPGALESGAASLTVIVPGLMSGHQIFENIRPNGRNAVIVYHSPRDKRMRGPAWPSLRFMDEPGGVWRFLTTNPLTKWYSLHQGMHEAPLDVSELVHWAVEQRMVDPARLNLVGVGSGALVAAAAADRLQALRHGVRTLVLVYPPADVALAVRDNLYPVPMIIGEQVGDTVSWLGRRLRLERHLPHLSQASKQLIIPLEAFELASYAAMPAVALAGENSQVARPRFGYSSLTLNENVSSVQTIVTQWLRAQGTID